MAEDDAALMERLAALEAEVKADADAQRSRKEAALSKLRESRAAQQAEKAEHAAREQALVKRKSTTRVADDDDDDGSSSDLGGALELASKANRVHKELAKTPGQGEKSWVKSGLASLVLGPFGWLYAGSFREAIPASVAWLAFATLASKILPSVLLMPIMFVVMPLSAIAGVVYAMQFNRNGKRQRLWGKDKGGKGKDLPGKDKKRLSP